MINHGYAMPRTETSDPSELASAAIVHAAAALYLGLRGRDLRDVLARGFSLADVAEWRGRSPGGLERAILDALRRTGRRDALAAGVVEQVIAAQDRRGWRIPTAA